MGRIVIVRPISLSMEEPSVGFGHGLLGHRLLDRQLDQAWTAPEDWSPNAMDNDAYMAKYE
jgi:hypothetical protein